MNLLANSDCSHKWRGDVFTYSVPVSDRHREGSRMYMLEKHKHL